MHVPEPLLIAAAVLFVGAVAASYVDRLGAPTLLLFLGLGMLLGENGPGGIAFDNAVLSRDAGTVALIVILLEGGLLAERSHVRRAAPSAAMLATVGVLVTAGVVAGAARLVLDVGWLTALLLGAVVSSTDAAAVFTAIRGIDVRQRVGSILEAESGLNDPFAAVLVIGLIEWQTNDAYGVADAALLLGRQALLGVLGGIVVGAIAVWLLRRLPLPSEGLAPVVCLSAGLGGALGVSALGGSGLLTAYLAGLAIGDARVPNASIVRGFMQGAAWLSQLGLFVLLGLLVTPSRLVDEGFTPLLLAIVLVVVARPLAVAVSMTPFGVPWREQGFLAWAGLRGGVPIVFATFPVAAGVPGASRVFDVAFYVVVGSVAIQGLTVRRAARLLGVTAEPT